MIKTREIVISAAMFLAASSIGSGAEAASTQTLQPVDGADLPLENSPIWDHSFTVRGGVGYKDNVLLNKHNRQKSGFWLSAGDFFLIREQGHGNHLTAFGTFEDRRYFSAEGINKEQLGTGQIDFKRDLSANWQAGVVLQYVYLDQVLDVSITENISQAIPVRAHSLSGAPYLAVQLPWDMRLETRFEIERQFIKLPLDDFWEAGPEITVTKRYGNRSDLFASYAFHERAYDNRRQFSLDFETIPDTSLKFYKHILEAGVKHYWDADRRWRTTVKGAYERTEENGSGFYDYDKIRASIQGAYVQDSWEARLQGRVTHYQFDRQPVEFGNSTALGRTEWNVNAQLRRNLWKTLAVFVESDHEWVESNFNIDSYHANTVMAGAEFEF